MHTLPPLRLAIAVLAITVSGLLVPTNAFARHRQWWRHSLVATPSSISFGSVPVGKSSSHAATLVNTSSYRVSISSANMTAPQFGVSGLSLPTTLDAGQQITFTVTFKPSSSAAASGSLAVVWGRRNRTLSIPVAGSGTATGTLSVSPASLSFGSVPVGTSKTLSASLTASGATATVSSVTTTNSEFTVTGMSLPATIAAGRSVPFSVKFTPKTSGTASASLSFVNSETSSPITEVLSGAGVAQAAQHSVDLSWRASSSATGYNIYRGTVSGGPYSKMNLAPDATIGYSDSSVQSGKTYYYVVTAVNSAGAESAHSNQATAVVP